MKTISAAMLLASAHALPSPQQIEQFAAGLLLGVLTQEELTEYLTCAALDPATAAQDVETAVADFKTRSVAGVIGGLDKLSDAFKILASGLDLCAHSKDRAKLDKIINELKAGLGDPKSFALHVGHDILFNGVDIEKHINAGVADYDSGDMLSFGDEMGAMLAEVVVGTELMVAQESLAQEAAEIISGILIGAVKAEGLTNIQQCIQDGEAIVQDAETAYADYKAGGLSNMIKALHALGDAVTKGRTALTDCKGIIADFDRLESLAAVLKNPATLSYEVGKHLVLNGVEIYGDLNDSVNQFENQHYEPFGEDVGEALAKLLLGGALDVQQELDGGDGLYLF